MDIICLILHQHSTNGSFLMVSYNVGFERHISKLFILHYVKNKKCYASLNIKYLDLVTLPYLIELRLLNFLDVW